MKEFVELLMKPKKAKKILSENNPNVASIGPVGNE